MSKANSAHTDDKLGAEIPQGEVNDPSYKSRRGDRAPIEVIDDDAPIEDPFQSGDADSDKQLKKDEAEAIDKSNIIEGQTRRRMPEGRYVEPTDEQMGLTE
ncbi:hypothetical protein B0T16DRAFT_338908 [Cercophora newfieldiana]|uniref:Histone chaperone domain-containing protein n=1 Tax=Cercophora newfieldiana TaxID=92897 RepID=A0AA39XT61_9PEZI|nr:hypothetical protein B0T16DRAFT_338908 [Cercophora newfieldiana]